VVFDETIFPFSKLNPNVGARLRSEILPLPHHLLVPIPGGESLNDSCIHVHTNPSSSAVENLVSTGVVQVPSGGDLANTGGVPDTDSRGDYALHRTPERDPEADSPTDYPGPNKSGSLAARLAPTEIEADSPVHRQEFPLHSLVHTHVAPVVLRHASQEIRCSGSFAPTEPVASTSSQNQGPDVAALNNPSILWHQQFRHDPRHNCSMGSTK
jgi:hypothetical protein